jgi:hypothetical protein
MFNVLFSIGAMIVGSVVKLEDIQRAKLVDASI